MSEPEWIRVRPASVIDYVITDNQLRESGVVQIDIGAPDHYLVWLELHQSIVGKESV